MRSLRAQIKLTIVLGSVCLLAGLFTHLALTDIYHREADVTLEWQVVRVCSIIFVAFLITSLWPLGLVLKSLQ